MTNALQEALTRQTRQAIFSAIAKKADEKMISVLDVAIDKIASKDAEIAELVAALERIANPISYMQANLKDGERLNGAMAVQLSESASYLKGLATDALAKVRKINER